MEISSAGVFSNAGSAASWPVNGLNPTGRSAGSGVDEGRTVGVDSAVGEAPPAYRKQARRKGAGRLPHDGT
jgi:hypothetical protein